MKTNFNPLLLCLSMFVFGGQESSGQSQRQSKPEFKSLSSDYFYKNGERYLMNRSPLSEFPGYKDLFDGQLWEINYASQGYGPDQQDKNYVAVWKLVGDTLYLSDLTFLSEPDAMWKQYDRDSAYHRTAVLTGTAGFDPTSHASKVPPVSSQGVIHAIWFTDTLYVKKALSGNSPQPKLKNNPAWINIPYEQMMFQNGVLIERNIVRNQSNISQRLLNTKVHPNSD